MSLLCAVEWCIDWCIGGFGHLHVAQHVAQCAIGQAQRTWHTFVYMYTVDALDAVETVDALDAVETVDALDAVETVDALVTCLNGGRRAATSNLRCAVRLLVVSVGRVDSMSSSLPLAYQISAVTTVQLNSSVG